MRKQHLLNPRPPPESARESAAESAAGAVLVELVQATPDGSLVISGRGVAHDVIRLFHGDKQLAETTANASGEWTLVPDGLLEPGAYLLTLHTKEGHTKEGRAKEGRAKEGADADVAVVVVIPARDEHAPLVALVPSDDSEKQAKLLQSPLADGASSQIRITQTQETQPITAPNALPRVTITAIEALSATRMAVRGDAIGDAIGRDTVAVSINGVEAEVARKDNQYTAQGAIPSRARFPHYRHTKRRGRQAHSYRAHQSEQSTTRCQCFGARFGGGAERRCAMADCLSYVWQGRTLY